MKKLKLILISHGIKTIEIVEKKGYRVLPKADLYVDCRGVVDHADVKTATAKSPDTLCAMYMLIVDALRHIPARRGGPDPYAEPFTVLFMCARGVNRSVASKQILGAQLKAAGFDVEVR